ncbi:MAG: hypothetical protein KAQ96_08385, partial [Thermoplasmata archaeon]|nr:hypothetical protein [Thermoplasmata archaeon]
MGSRINLSILLVAFLALPLGAVDGLDVTVDTQIPEYILDDHLNLTGTTNITRGSWVETSNGDYQLGTTDNVSVSGGSVNLKPSLSFNILNGGNAVLKPGTGTAWDTVLITGYSIVKVDSTYYMHYVGSRGTSLMNARHIGLATSTDGLSWTKYSGNPILSARVNSYDWTNLNNPSVVIDNGTWHMWYAGNHGNQNAAQSQDIDICYATSPDGYNWTKSSSNPVIANGFANWAMDALRPYNVQWNGSAFVMYYKGRSVGLGATSRLGLATSTDGVTWSQNPNNPLRRGDQNGWEDGEFECGAREMATSTHRMWTMGDGGPYKLGWVWSEDGIDWEDSGSAILSPQQNTIYANQIMYPRVFDEGNTYLVWARCWDSNGYRTIGAFRATPTDLTGSYVSRRYDAGGVVNVTGIAWNGTILGGGTGSTEVSEGGELTISLRWSNSTSSWSTWRRMDAMDDLEGLSATYFQYKVEFQAYQDWFRLRFGNFSLSYDVPITSVDISVDGDPWEPVMGTFGNWWLDLSLHDGDYYIRVRVIDSAGDQVVRTIPIKVDLYPPTGGILIEDGRYAHNSTRVKIDVAANDTHGPIEMQLSRQPDFAGAAWIDHIPSATYQLLGSPEGEVTIYMRLRDDAGRISETYNDTIVIDTTPPDGWLLINDGAKCTNATMVTLSWNATDITGVIGMMASNDPDFGGAMWQDPMRAFSWMIGEADGVHTVYLKVQDFVGWETVLTDDIILDRTPPAASLSIDQDAPFTTSLDVTLNITLYDENPISYKLANLGDPWPDPWSTTGSPIDIPWTLDAGPDGQRSVRMLVRDATSNEFIATDDIVLDTTPPEGTLVLNDGDPFTNDLLTTATLSAIDVTSGLNRMRISGSDDFTGASWQTVKETFTWPLSPGDGTKTLFVQVRDVAGLVTTLDASIILDTVPPSGTVSIKGVTEFARESSVELILDFQDDFGLDSMMVSSESGFLEAVWVPYSSLHVWDLGDTDGEVTVHVRVRDLAGNTFTATVSTILDLTPPVLSVGVPEHTMSRSIEFGWSAEDTLGLEMQELQLLDSEDSLIKVTTVPLEGTTAVIDRIGLFEIPEDVISGDSDSYTFTFVIGVFDLSGWYKAVTNEVTYIPEIPRGALTINFGAEWTNKTKVDLLATHTGGLSQTHFRVATSETGLETAEWRTFDPTLPPFSGGPVGGYTSITLDGPGGEKTVWCQLKGAFDIVSESFSDDITLDVVAPVVDIVSPNSVNTEDDTAKLLLSVSDDLDTTPVVEYRFNKGLWRPYMGEERLSLKEGDNLIEVRAEDKAGNVGTAEWTITSDRGLSVGGASWLILLVIVVVVAIVVLW